MPKPRVRHVRLFQNGRNQAVRIPREFELPGTEALMRKEGTRLIIEPLGMSSLVEFLRNAPPIEDDFDFGAELRTDPVDL